MPSNLRNFISVTRLNKPVGFLLLFWPCSWGLSLGLYFEKDLNTFLYYMVLFFLGSVLMRSAGCIVNDIVDEKFDKKVSRTMNRPIASRSLNKTTAWIYVLILCSLAFLVLIQFNFLTIYLGLGSMILAFSYPFMKRITYWPQLFLGLTFNWGIIMAWSAMNNTINIDILLLYLSAIFWTLGYDTIYGAQDMFDDEIIGLKSTSIKFKKNIKLFLGFCYLSTSLIILYLMKSFIGLNISSIFLIIFLLSLIYQVLILKQDSEYSCLSMFKLNNFSGLFLFLSILTVNF